MILMYKIAVMGERDSIYGFASVGLDTFPVSDNTHALRTLRQLSETGYAIVYMTEKLFSALGSELDPYNEKPLPAIIAIPGATGNTGCGLASVKKSVERAVGSDIIFGNE